MKAFQLAAMVALASVLGATSYDRPSRSAGFPLSLDCTEGAKWCPAVEIQGDPLATLNDRMLSPFRGNADPTLRQDPVTGRLWMAYSWPNVHVLGLRKLVPSVDVHLAHSVDGGRTWQSDGPLWPSQPDTDRGGSGEAGYTVHEVANLLPVKTERGVTWFAARLDYFLPENGGYKRMQAHSFRIRVMQADSPKELADAPAATLGSVGTADGWDVDTDLSKLAAAVRDCGLWNEPALYFENSTLYLALRCMVFDGRSGKNPNEEASSLVVFATHPSGDVRQWKWRYVGKLAGSAEAKDLGGEGLTQVDLARGADGRLLAIVTPEKSGASPLDADHQGCRVVEVRSIDPPALARDPSGKLKVRAVITASDLMPLGPGACAYDPSSATGVLMVRRHKAPGMMTLSMHATGLKP